MPTSLIPQERRSSSVQHKREADQRELQLLDDHRPMELLDDVVVAIIDQTYGALLEILGLAAPPEGGGPVKVSEELVDAADPDAPPMLCVVEASARHCCISLIDDGSGAVGIGGRECKRYASLRQMRRQLQTRRATVSASPGKVHLARRVDGGEGERSWKCAGLVSVLETITAHLDTAIQVEAGMIAMARASGCGTLSMIMKSHDNLREVIKVRMALLRMRREVDLGAIMRRKSAYRRSRRAQRPAAEIDVDQVDEAEVLTKRLKAMHV